MQEIAGRRGGKGIRPKLIARTLPSLARSEEGQMLILTRRVGESVMIGDAVTITVLRVKGNQVRLGVNAPRTVSVQREEISDRIRATAAPDSGSPDSLDGDSPTLRSTLG